MVSQTQTLGKRKRLASQDYCVFVVISHFLYEKFSKSTVAKLCNVLAKGSRYHYTHILLIYYVLLQILSVIDFSLMLVKNLVDM